jgi:hypothetical protein
MTNMGASYILLEIIKIIVILFHNLLFAKDLDI